MTQEPESKESDNQIEPSAEKRFVQQALQAFVGWSPFGGLSIAFGAFLFKQEWAMALILFPVTAVSVVWGAYSKNFIDRLSEIYAERGKKGADGLVANMDRWNQALTETIKWQSSGFEAKYLKCQEYDCHEDKALGLNREQIPVNIPLLQDVFVPLQLTTDHIDSGYKSQMRNGDDKPMQIWELLGRVRQNDRAASTYHYRPKQQQPYRLT